MGDVDGNSLHTYCIYRKQWTYEVLIFGIYCSIMVHIVYVQIYNDEMQCTKILIWVDSIFKYLQNFLFEF